MIVVVVLFVLFALWADKPSSGSALDPIVNPALAALKAAPGTIASAAGWSNGGMMLPPPPRTPGMIDGIVDPSSINGGPV